MEKSYINFNIFRKLEFIRFIVRSKKDKDALTHLLEKFWYFSKIETIKEKNFLGLIKQLSKNLPIFLFLSKKDKEIFEFNKLKKYLVENNLNNVYIIEINKSKLRNERLNVLFNKIQFAFKSFSNRFDVKSFKFSPFSVSYEDVFLPSLFYLHIFSSRFNLSNTDLAKNFIGLKEKDQIFFYSYLKFNSESFSKNLNHDFFMKIDLSDMNNFKQFNFNFLSDFNNLFNDFENDFKASYHDFMKNVIRKHPIFENKHNLIFLEFLINHSKNFVFQVLKFYEPDYVVIPFSGGKDSLGALLLILDVIKDIITPNTRFDEYIFKNKKFIPKIVPIYIKTTYEFKELEDYVNFIERSLNIPIIKSFIDFSSLTYDDFKNRVCTQMKIRALYDEINKLKGKILVVVGNRAGESFNRRKRGWLWQDQWLFVAPLFLWNYLTLQYFVYVKHDLYFNPLYDFGLYRTGCWNCPFVSEFEKQIIKSLGYRS